LTPAATTVDRPSTAPIDPRIRARRIAVRRDEGRRRLHRLTALGVILAVGVASVLVTRSPLLDVDRVAVSGAAHTSPDAVRTATGIRRHSPMTDLDLGRARDGVLLLPWVKTVSISKQWPGTVKVSVVERNAVAAAPATAGGYVLVDAEGRLLEAVPAPPAGVAVLVDVAPAGAAGGVLDPSAGATLAVARALPKELVPQVAGVVATADGVALRLAVGGTVRLGATDGLGPKLLAVATFLAQVDLTDLCTLDVRVPSAPSLTRGTPCA
jgi:cell division protein FtsQ